MVEQGAKNSERAQPKRRRVVVVAIVLAIVFTVVWFARAPIASTLTKSAAFRLAGVELSWTSFSLEGFSKVSIRGLRVRGARDDAPIRSLDVDALDVVVEPLKIWREGLSGLRSLHARGVRGEYRATEARASSPQVSPSSAFHWPTELPDVRLDDVDFALTLSRDRVVKLRGAHVALEPRGVPEVGEHGEARGLRAQLEIAIESLSWSEPGRIVDHPLVVMATYDAGRFEIVRAEWDPRVVLSHAEVDLSRAASGVSSFACAVTALGGTASIVGTLEHEALEVDATITPFDLHEGVAFFTRNATTHDLGANAARPSESNPGESNTGDIELAARIALHGHATIPLAEPLRMSAAVELSASDVDIYGVRFDTLVGRLRAHDGTLDAEDVFAVRRANAIQLDFARMDFVPWDGCTVLDRLFASAHADIGALPTFLREVLRETPNADVDPADIAPIRVRATLAGGAVEGTLATEHMKLARVLQLFDLQSLDATSAVDADVDLRAHVVLPIQDARRTSGEVSIDARAVDLFTQHFELVRGRLRVDEHAAHAEEVLAISGGNIVEVPYAELRSDSWTACDALERAVARLSVELTDIPTLVRDAHDVEDLANLPEHRLTFRGALFDDAIQIDNGEFETAGNSFRIEEGRVPLQTDLRAIVHDPELDLSLTLKFDEIRRVWEIFEASLPKTRTPPSGSVAGRVRIRGDRAGPRGRLTLRAQHVTIGDARVDDATVRADVDADAISVEKLDAETSLGSLSAQGRWRFSSESLVGARVEADLVDLAQLAPGRLTSGAVHLSAQLDGRLNALDGFVRFDAEDLSFAGVRIENAALEARATHGQIAIAELSGKSGPFAARLAGNVEALDIDARRWRLDLTRLALDVEGASLALAEPTRIEIGPASISVDRLILASAEGELRASGSIDGDTTCVDVRARGVALEPLLAHFVRGLPTATSVDMELHVEREGDLLRATTQGTLTTTLGAARRDWSAARAPAAANSSSAAGSASANGSQSKRDPDPSQPVEAGNCALSWNATLEGRRLTLQSVEFNASTAGDNSVFVSVGGSVPLDLLGSPILADGPIDVRAAVSLDELALLPFAPSFGGLRGAARADFDLRGTWNHVTGTTSFTTENLVWRAFDSVDDIGPCSIDGTLTFGDDITLRDVHATLPGDARIDVSGKIAAPLDVRALAAGDTSTLRTAELALDAKLAAVDLAPIGRHVPTLRRTGGRVRADVTVRGSLADPKVDGTATLADGEIRTMSSLPALSSLRGDVRFDGSVLKVENLRGELGGAPFSMQGSATLFGPNESIDLSIEGKSLLLYRQNDVSVRADAKLHLHGPLSGLELSGDVALENSRYARKFDFLALPRRSAPKPGRRGFQLFSLREAPFDRMRFDIRVTSATPFEVSNNIARGKLRPELTLAGTGELPELRGTVYIDPSRVLLPSGTLQVRSGRVEFRLDQPEVPMLDIQAHTRLQGYDIDINVSGPYDDPRVDFSSVPPLSREDLALLVITGRPPGNGLSLATGQRAALDVAVYIARDVAAAWLGGDEDAAESFAERLEVIVGSDTTKSGADAVLVRMRLTGKLAERADSLYLTGERDIYDFYNFGLRFVFTFQ